MKLNKKNIIISIFIIGLVCIIIGLIFAFKKKNIEKMTNTLNTNNINLENVRAIIRNQFNIDFANYKNIEDSVNDINSKLNRRITVPSNVNTRNFTSNDSLSSQICSLTLNSNEGPEFIFRNTGKTRSDQFGHYWKIFNMNSSYGNNLQFWKYDNGYNERGANFRLNDNQTIDFTGKFDISGNINIENKNIFIDNIPIVPSGTILMWWRGFNTVPSGWVICDGSNGTPDLRGRFIYGWDDRTNNNRPIRTTGGAESVEIRIEHLPPHRHNYDIITTTSSRLDLDHTSPRVHAQNYRNTGTNTGTTQRSGVRANDRAANHENMPPFIVLDYIMKL